LREKDSALPLALGDKVSVGKVHKHQGVGILIEDPKINVINALQDLERVITSAYHFWFRPAT